MAIAQKETVEKKGSKYVIRDTKSGRFFQLKGYGALKGQIAFRRDVDLTKPIAEQVTKINARRKKADTKKAAEIT